MKRFTRMSTYLVGIALLAAIAPGCQKDHDKIPVDDEVEITPLVRPQGQSLGPVVSKQIGAAGGTVETPGGAIKLQIPPGALNAETTIGIEPITNTNIAGVGPSFRLTPHGQQFAQPVTITYAYGNYTDSIPLTQTLGLSYQDENGVWRFVGADQTDIEMKRVSYRTKHFSNWSMMNRISLAPLQADLDPGATQTVRALVFTPVDSDDLLAPLSNDPNGAYYDRGYPVGEAAPMPSRFIKSWELHGPGNLTRASSSTVTYKAPASVEGMVTATVTLELNSPTPGTYLLLSKLNVLGNGWIELSIAGGAPVKFPASGIGKMGDRYLLSNPENEGGGYFLLAWNGGVGVYNYDLSNTGNHFHFQTSTTTYMSRFADPEVGLFPSGGQINITKLSNGRAEGTFTVTDAGYGPTLTSKTTASGKFSAKLNEQ
ncbi:hypothetical protein [Flavihumibacter petaseus]|uniref:ZU5 domain-containing protein n=1 Tax=Flavihumibacter petaseus NBRC 106054 TaxID=1220578 RepID=A0A0E9MZW2_9BACT|nr:hypothetical protein [Flavihumibacter petaseus]GAO43078.1 hypothetical protein FPE01S_02_01830 [Flavihumibacter petaseus NBRC 106054]